MLTFRRTLSAREGLLVRFILLFCFVTSVYAECPFREGSPNCLTIRELSGKFTANYPIQLGRPFKPGEIREFPQVLVNGQAIATQADVKQRYPDGSVKHAILSFHIPELFARQTVEVTFQNQQDCHCGSELRLAKDQMLDSAYDFDARMELQPGSHCSGCRPGAASARQILEAWDGTTTGAAGTQIWLEGSIATSIILADHASKKFDIGWKQDQAKPIAALRAEILKVSGTQPLEIAEAGCGNGFCTIRTYGEHALEPLDQVNITGSAVAPLNGSSRLVTSILGTDSFQIEAPQISGNGTGGTIQSAAVTVTTAGPHNFWSGDAVTVTQVRGMGLNGGRTVAAVTAPDKFKVAYLPNQRYQSGGIAVVNTFSLNRPDLPVEDASGISVPAVMRIRREFMQVCAIEGQTLKGGNKDCTSTTTAEALPAGEATSTFRVENGGIFAANTRWVIEDGINPAEIVLVSSVSGSSGRITVRRAQNGTTAAPHAEQARIRGYGRSQGYTAASALNPGLMVYPPEFVETDESFYKTFRPVFHATFYPATKQVRVRFIGEITDTEKFGDQIYSLLLSTGAISQTPVYSKSEFLHHAGMRWTKEFWIGGEPSRIEIDHNLAYVKDTKFTYNYDTRIRVSTAGINDEVNQWQRLPEADKDIAGAGKFMRYMPSPGGRNELGPYPRQVARWLYTGDARLWDIAKSQAELGGSWPVHLREGNTRKWFDKGRSIEALGHVVSMRDRPAMVTKEWFERLAGTDNDSKLRMAGFGSWGDGYFADSAHFFDHVTPLYALSGDYFYLEEAWFWSSYMAAWWSNYHTWFKFARGPSGAEGGIGGEYRGRARTLTSRVNTWFVSPDGSPEKQYFKELTDEHLAIELGARGMDSPEATQHPAEYEWGATYRRREQFTGPMIYGSVGSNQVQPLISPIGTMDAGYIDDGFCSESQADVNPDLTDRVMATWQMSLVTFSLGRTYELGFEAAKPLLHQLGRYYLGWLNSPDINKYSLSIYCHPTTKKPGEWFNTFAEVNAALDPSEWSRKVWHQYGDVEHGYAHMLPMAVSFLQGEDGFANAWQILDSELLQHPNYKSNPKMAIVPRQTQ